MNVNDIFSNTAKVFKKYSSELLTAIGIGGMVATTVLAVKATPKAIEKIKKDSREKHNGDPYGYTKKEAIESAWKYYIPSITTGAISISCIIVGNTVANKRNMVLAAAYKLSENALKEYKEATLETVGPKKEESIRDLVAKKHVENNPVESSQVIVTTKGETLCYDVISGRYFKSDIEKIKKCVNELNRQMLQEMYISLNDFYYELGLEQIAIGYDIGWNVDTGLIDVYFSSQLTSDGTPCLTLQYSVEPKYDYCRNL